MNAKKAFGLSLLLVVTTAAAAAAAPGTNKSLGVYNRGGWESGGGPARHRYTQRAPAAHYAPSVQAVPAPAVSQAPQVAQAPVEGRRYSYAPAAQAATSPCPPVTTVDSGRRYSYAPSATAAAPPQASAPRMYYSQPSYSAGHRSGGHKDLWALPKTDPRKYNSR